MRRLVSIAVLLLAGCGGTTPNPTILPGGTEGAGGSTPVPQASTGGPGPTPAPPASQGTGAGVTIPAACAAGFTDYLKQIEPLVSAFDPSKAKLGEFGTVDEAVKEKGVQILMDNNATATYSCPEVGLQFAYFDTATPWDTVLALASTVAPGTVAYLDTTRRERALDAAKLADYGIADCNAAAAKIKGDVADGLAAGFDTVDDMTIDDGLDLLGLYNAFVAQVRDGACPDALSNDEFGFMGTH